jgi:hypothetical protein
MVKGSSVGGCAFFPFTEDLINWIDDTTPKSGELWELGGEETGQRS